jgi:hypothetical protein
MQLSQSGEVMILRTRNERVLYAALELVCRKANPELAGLMVDSAIVQADDALPKVQVAPFLGYSYRIAEVHKGMPMPEDL